MVWLNCWEKWNYEDCSCWSCDSTADDSIVDDMHSCGLIFLWILTVMQILLISQKIFIGMLLYHKGLSLEWNKESLVKKNGLVRG